MDTNEPQPELSEEELRALIEQAGLELAPTELAGILATARFLRRAAERVGTFNAAADESRS